MKKIIGILMIMVLLMVSLTACGNNDSRQSAADSQAAAVADSENTDSEDIGQDQAVSDGSEADAEADSQDQTAADSEKSSESENQGTDAADSSETADDTETDGSTAQQAGKVLVVYYSATGNTKKVADVIAEQTGGDTFELVPVNDYTQEDLDWTEDSSRVNQEHDDESLQDIELVSTMVDDFDSYDTVFIGYPIWRQIAAWPVNNFVKDNDFTGKKVIPFCTSSSELGESEEKLAEMAGTGDWQEGQRFRGSAGEEEVIEWVNGLGL